MNRKKPNLTNYSTLNNDDIRTIPDFYDNLYPSFESSSFPEKLKSLRNSKKSDIKRNNEKSKEK